VDARRLVLIGRILPHFLWGGYTSQRFKYIAVDKSVERSNVISRATYFQRLAAGLRLTLHSNPRVLVSIVNLCLPRLKRNRTAPISPQIFILGAFSPEKPKSQGFKQMQVNQRFARSNPTRGVKYFTSKILNLTVDSRQAGTVAKWPKWRYRRLSDEICKAAGATRSPSARALFLRFSSAPVPLVTAECTGTKSTVADSAFYSASVVPCE
jgi:hypothetical protein